MRHLFPRSVLFVHESAVYVRSQEVIAARRDFLARGALRRQVSPVKLAWDFAAARRRALAIESSISAREWRALLGTRKKLP